jgi:hypothetical protein
MQSDETRAIYDIKHYVRSVRSRAFKKNHAEDWGAINQITQHNITINCSQICYITFQVLCGYIKVQIIYLMHWALDGRVAKYAVQTKCCGTSHLNVSGHRKVLLQFLSYLKKMLV